MIHWTRLLVCLQPQTYPPDTLNQQKWWDLREAEGGEGRLKNRIQFWYFLIFIWCVSKPKHFLFKKYTHPQPREGMGNSIVFIIFAIWGPSIIRLGPSYFPAILSPHITLHVKYGSNLIQHFRVHIQFVKQIQLGALVLDTVVQKVQNTKTSSQRIHALCTTWKNTYITNFFSDMANIWRNAHFGAILKAFK